MVASFAPFPTCCLCGWLQYSWGQCENNESGMANCIKFAEDMTYMTVWCINDVSRLRAPKIPSSLPLTWTMNHFDIVSFHVCILIFEISLQVKKGTAMKHVFLGLKWGIFYQLCWAQLEVWPSPRSMNGITLQKRWPRHWFIDSMLDPSDGHEWCIS